MIKANRYCPKCNSSNTSELPDYDKDGEVTRYLQCNDCGRRNSYTFNEDMCGKERSIIRDKMKSEWEWIRGSYYEELVNELKHDETTEERKKFLNEEVQRLDRLDGYGNG